MTPDQDPDLTTAMLIGGPQDGTTVRVAADNDNVQVLEHNDLPVGRAHDTNRLRLPAPWQEVTYQWDGTTNFVGTRRYRRVKP